MWQVNGFSKKRFYSKTGFQLKKACVSLVMLKFLNQAGFLMSLQK